MTPTHIEHIGIAVASLEEAIPRFRLLLGTDCYAVEDVADQKVRTAFFKVGQTKIELLESTAPDGPIAKFIEKRGEGLHHIAIKVPDFDAVIERLKASGARLLNNPRQCVGGHTTVFVHPASTGGVLLELIKEN